VYDVQEKVWVRLSGVSSNTGAGFSSGGTVLKSRKMADSNPASRYSSGVPGSSSELMVIFGDCRLPEMLSQLIPTIAITKSPAARALFLIHGCGKLNSDPFFLLLDEEFPCRPG
jgi:hypothetical protein